MKVYIQIKSAGNRSAARRAENPFAPKTPDRLARVPYELPDSVSTLRELIAALVRIEVGRYNEKGADRQLIPFLTGEEIREQAGRRRPPQGIRIRAGRQIRPTASPRRRRSWPP